MSYFLVSVISDFNGFAYCVLLPQTPVKCRGQICSLLCFLGPVHNCANMVVGSSHSGCIFNPATDSKNLIWFYNCAHHVLYIILSFKTVSNSGMLVLHVSYLLHTALQQLPSSQQILLFRFSALQLEFIF